MSDNEIEIFREYLRIPTVHPNVNYVPCVEFLQKQAKRLGLSVKIHYPAHPEKPVVVLSWIGKQPQLPSILLNSHMDVVLVYDEYWNHPPFGADIVDGRIYARGTQDMKSVAMQYLATIGRLKNDRVQLKRTVHIVFVPDEEVGGTDGMMKFVQTDEFRLLNVGFALDEGMASETDVFPVYYGERSVWRISFECSGTTGHGSLLHKDTAAEKVRYIVDQMMDYRENEVKKLENNDQLTIGDVTTINFTRMMGGVQTNVVPPMMRIGFDVRLAIDVDHDEFEKMLHCWCAAAGGNINIVFESKKPKVKPTAIDDTNLFWVAFKEAICGKLGLKIRTLIRPGRSDSCFLREIGIPAIGFSPMNYTAVLLHDHNEFIKTDTYLQGVEIYRALLLNIANV